LTNGHLDIIERSARLFDEVVVAILLNPSKQSMFPVEDRQRIITDVVASDRVRVDTFHGLLVHYAVEQEATAIIRGIRAAGRDRIPDVERSLLVRELSSRQGSRITRRLRRRNGPGDSRSSVGRAFSPTDR
jgi:pantetheine-phosphate adenylyltransferase